MGTPQQATTRAQYNARGQLRAIIDANGNQTDFEYDGNGRMQATVAPPDDLGGPRARQSFTYDAAGRLGTVTDAEGRIVTYEYDLRDRLRVVRYPDLSTETFTYGTDALANLLVSQTDRNGNVTKLEYDETKRLQAMVMAFGTSAEVRDVIEYEPGTSLVRSETRRGERIDYERDARNRIISATTQLPARRTLTSQTVWDQAAIDRVAKETDPYGRSTFTVYDLSDHPARSIRELVPGGVPAESDLQTLPRIFAPNPPYVIEETTYDPMGQLTARSDGRGVLTTYGYDAQGRQVERIEASGTAVAAKTVTEYDPQDNVIRVTHPRTFSEGVPFMTEYAYTGRNLRRLERLAAGSADQATQTTLYTLTGKVASSTDARGNTTSFTYDASDRLRTVVDPQSHTTTNTYDAYGNLLSVLDPNGNTATYQYDALHRRTHETNGELETVNYSYDDNLADGSGLDGLFPTYFLDFAFAPGAVGSAVLRTNAKGETALTISDSLGRTGTCQRE